MNISKEEHVSEVSCENENPTEIDVKGETVELKVSKEEGAPHLSKRQERKMRKKEQWLAKLPAKRAKEREKFKLKRQAARLNNVCLPSRKRLKQSTMANSSCKVRVAIDLGFDDLMNSRDLGKCVKQLMRCYTLNRRASNPIQLYFTSFNGKSEQEMGKNNGYSNWDVKFEDKDYIDVFPQDDIVYLSSESENLITSLDDSKVYIIGGLVDHNAHKGLCHRLATEKQIAHGQLPISEFLELKSRKVLTIDHVFEILLGVSEGLSWKEAFLKVLPQRKVATVRTETGDESVASTPSDIDESKESGNLQTSSSPEMKVLEIIEDQDFVLSSNTVSVSGENKELYTSRDGEKENSVCFPPTEKGSEK